MQQQIREASGGRADLVLSDIAPDATGRRIVDRLRAEAVGEAVLEFAVGLLGPDGRVLVKLVKGAEAAVRDAGRARFRTFRPLRPEATRSESSEIFLLASGLPAADGDA